MPSKNVKEWYDERVAKKKRLDDVANTVAIINIGHFVGKMLSSTDKNKILEEHTKLQREINSGTNIITILNNRERGIKPKFV